MAIYLKIENNIVTDSIVADQAFIDAGYVGNPSLWIESSYGGIGWLYYPDTTKFMSVKPEGTWTFNELIHVWERPIPFPIDGKDYTWDESIQNWKEIS